jgi:Flp pilus assembly protein TadG
MGSFLARARSQEAGAELVEYALLAPVLMLVLLGMAEFGLFFQAFIVVNGAAREGARMGILARESDVSYYSTTDITNRVASFVTAGLPAGSGTPTTVVTCGVPSWSGIPTYQAETVTVTLNYNFRFIGPIASFFGRSYGTFPIRAKSTMRRELQTCPSG